jgi:hypothetical protein
MTEEITHEKGDRTQGETIARINGVLLRGACLMTLSLNGAVETKGILVEEITDLPGMMTGSAESMLT